MDSKENEHNASSASKGIAADVGMKFSVLDDCFIRLVDWMGDDSSIVQAARVSYGEGTKKLSEDRGLIRYLMRHRHTTPFEMCEIKLHVRVPMDCWRQWIRHRTANVGFGDIYRFEIMILLRVEAKSLLCYLTPILLKNKDSKKR